MYTLQDCVKLGEYGLKATISNGKLEGFAWEKEKESIRRRIAGVIRGIIAESGPACRF